MKTKFLKLSVLFLTGVLMASCGKDDDSIAPENDASLPTKFSGLTVGQNKQKLVENEARFDTQVAGLSKADGTKCLIALKKHFEVSKGLSNTGGRSSSVSTEGLIEMIASLGKKEYSIVDVLTALDVDDHSLKTFANELKLLNAGTYTFNSEDETWGFKAGGDKIVFKFPSTENGTKNNAEYSVSDYQLKADSLPAAAKIALVVDGNTKMQYSFSAEYNEKNFPVKVSQYITIDSYKFTYEATATSETEFNTVASFLEGTNVLVSLGGEASDAKQFSYLQIQNIKLAFQTTDVDKLMQEITQTELTSVEKFVAALNKYNKGAIYYADSNEKIADLEFFVNSAGEMSIRMIFEDGTKADLDSYSGFNDFEMHEFE